MKTQIIPATRELLLQYYGEPPPRTSRGFVAIKDGRVLGVAGFYIFDARLIVFVDISEELKKDKRAVIKGIRKVMKLVKEIQLPVYAMCDESIDKSANLLKHVGFVHEYKGVYAWHG